MAEELLDLSAIQEALTQDIAETLMQNIISPVYSEFQRVVEERDRAQADVTALRAEIQDLRDALHGVINAGNSWDVVRIAEEALFQSENP